MHGTVKQFKEALDEMKTIYPYEDEKTRLSTMCPESLVHNTLNIVTQDEKTGIYISMSKNIPIVEV